MELSLKLATAIALQRVHGTFYAASYLAESGVTLHVAIELLARKQFDSDAEACAQLENIKLLP